MTWATSGPPQLVFCTQLCTVDQRRSTSYILYSKVVPKTDNTSRIDRNSSRRARHSHLDAAPTCRPNRSAGNTGRRSRRRIVARDGSGESNIGNRIELRRYVRKATGTGTVTDDRGDGGSRVRAAGAASRQRSERARSRRRGILGYD